MKAIETIYNGRKYRSRLEARYAVLFDTLHIPFDYEPEGYDLDGLWYLPDFWLKDQHCWIEVKGCEPTDEDVEKVTRLFKAHSSDDPSVRVFLVGDIPAIDSTGHLTSKIWGLDRYELGNANPELFDDYSWTICPICQQVDITMFGLARDLNCGHYDHIRHAIDVFIPNSGPTQRPKWWTRKIIEFETIDNTPPLQEAFDLARMARFEHGANGR